MPKPVRGWRRSSCGAGCDSERPGLRSVQRAVFRRSGCRRGLRKNRSLQCFESLSYFAELDLDVAESRIQPLMIFAHVAAERFDPGIHRVEAAVDSARHDRDDADDDGRSPDSSSDDRHDDGGLVHLFSRYHASVVRFGCSANPEPRGPAGIVVAPLARLSTPVRKALVAGQPIGLQRCRRRPRPSRLPARSHSAQGFTVPAPAPV